MSSGVYIRIGKLDLLIRVIAVIGVLILAIAIILYFHDLVIKYGLSRYIILYIIGFMLVLISFFFAKIFEYL